MNFDEILEIKNCTCLAISPNDNLVAIFDDKLI